MHTSTGEYDSVVWDACSLLLRLIVSFGFLRSFVRTVMDARIFSARISTFAPSVIQSKGTRFIGRCIRRMTRNSANFSTLEISTVVGVIAP
jgi:hypothetical protein